MNFVNDSTGYFGGRFSEYEFKDDGSVKFQTHTTKLYRTQDAGRTWKDVELNELGEVQKIRFHQESIYVLSQFLNQPSSIYYSSDLGKTFTKVIAFPDSCYVRDFGFLNSGDLIVALDNKKLLNLLKVGNELDTIAVFKRSHYNVRIGQHKIYLINPSGGANSDGVTIFDPQTNSQRTENFGHEGFVTSTHLNQDHEYLVTLNQENEQGKLFLLQEDGFEEIDLGKYASYSLNTVYKNGSTILIDANQKEAVGPIGVTHELLISTDNGTTWNREDYPISLSVQPADLLSTGQFIVYQGTGKFQLRK